MKGDLFFPFNQKAAAVLKSVPHLAALFHHFPYSSFFPLSLSLSLRFPFSLLLFRFIAL